MGFKTWELLSAFQYNSEKNRTEPIRTEYIKTDHFSGKGCVNYHPVQLPDHFRADQKVMDVIKIIVQMPIKH